MAAHSPNRGRRRRPLRQERSLGLVVTEGKVTELNYLEMLKRHLRETGRPPGKVRQIGVGADPLTVVRRAVLERRRVGASGEPYDWVLCVVDVDEHAKLQEALHLAQRESVHVIVNNPKFEVWLLWHGEDHFAHLENKQLDKLVEARGYMTGKKHKVIDRSFPVDRFEHAVQTASRADRDMRVSRKGPNPSSAMPVLLEHLTGDQGQAR